MLWDCNPFQLVALCKCLGELSLSPLFAFLVTLKLTSRPPSPKDTCWCLRDSYRPCLGLRPGAALSRCCLHSSTNATRPSRGCSRAPPDLGGHSGYQRLFLLRQALNSANRACCFLFLTPLFSAFFSQSSCR